MAPRSSSDVIKDQEGHTASRIHPYRAWTHCYWNIQQQCIYRSRRTVSHHWYRRCDAPQEGSKTAWTGRLMAGWFLNADIVTAEAPDVEQRIQEIRIKAVTNRAQAQDKRFYSTDATRQYIDNLEATEQDQPQTLDRDIRILRESGITHVEVFWKEYREAVIGGSKANAT